MSIVISDLKTEYHKTPLMIPDGKPRFSWRYEGDGPFQQYSYRILVSLKEDVKEGDLWDSGTVFSCKNAAIEYCGRLLKSRMRCYWKVIINECMESSVTFFETGLLKQSDWKGTWISAQLTGVGGALFFRRDFEIPADKEVRWARAYVCGLGCHEFYCNGKKVGDELMQPSVSEYTKHIYACVYPFEKLLRPGKNAIGALVGYGWYGARKLLAQVHIDFTDGTRLEFYTANCADWWVCRTPITSNSFYDGETYDGRMGFLSELCNPDIQCGWENGWLYGMLCEKPSGKIIPQMLEGIRAVQEFPVVDRYEIEGNIVYDFGQNFAGFVRIHVKGTRGSRVIIRYGEQLKDKHVNQINLRTALAQDEYILSGEGEECYCPHFTYHGFRYVEVEIHGKVKIQEIVGIYIRNGVEKIGSFCCDNEILNVLHRNIVITEGSNQHGIFSDCPQRDERFGWLNDLSSRIFQSVNNYDLSSFLPKVVMDITDTQDEQGRIADTAPFFTGFRPADPVVVSYLLIALMSYRYYGDLTVLQKNYPYFCKWVDFLTAHVGEDGATLYARFADWCPPEVFGIAEDPASRLTPGDFVSIIYYYLHLQILATIAEILGYKEDCKNYRLRASNTKIAIQKKYTDPITGEFIVTSQACKAFLLGLGFAGDKSENLASSLNIELVQNGYHAITGNLSYVYLFFGLTEYGYGDTVYKILTNPEYPGWGYMVKNGATTVWERWEETMQQKMHSFCHPMFGSYDAWFYQGLAGIRLGKDACAMDRIIISPYFIESINEVHSEIKTINGVISVYWKREREKIHMEICIPLNVTAEINISNLKKVNNQEWQGDVYTMHCGGKAILEVAAAEKHTDLLHKAEICTNIAL